MRADEMEPLPALALGVSSQQRVRQARRVLRRTTLTVLTVLACLPFVIPLVWMTSASLLPEIDVTSSLALFPYHPQWQNYADALRYFPVWHYLLNTLEIIIPAALGTVISSAWIAYGFSNLQWKGREQVFLIVLALMMIPGWVTLIPLYVTFQKIHWVNTYLPLIVPNWFGSSFNIFLFRQFFMRQPPELLDAARIDGATEPRIFAQIVLPLATPAVAVAALFALVGGWTDFFGPLIYLTDPSKYTLMLGLAAFRDEHQTFLNLLMAGSAMVILPVFLLFLFMQRFFRQGLQLTGLVT